MQRPSYFYPLLYASAAVAALVVFVVDFFFLSDFTAWGEHECIGQSDEICALAMHLGKWWPLWDLVAAVLLATWIVLAVQYVIRLFDGSRGPPAET